MNTNDLIEAYVTEVAGQLPRALRNDVAFELRALLHEELQARAEAAGRGTDAAMTIELLRGFGRPNDVAARYRPTLAVIDPADGHAFVRAAIVGVAILAGLGLVAHLGRPIASAGDALGLVGQWWVGTVNASLWWLGALVVGFGASAWTRRRWPQSAEWTPRAADRIHGGRAALALALVGICGGLFVLLDPRWVLEFAFGGRAAPAAVAALTYTDAFRAHQAPWLFGLLVLNLPLFATVMVMGRWSPWVRRLQAGLALATCAAMAWTVAAGPIFPVPASDGMAKLCMVLIIAVTLIDMGLRLHRSVRPAPGNAVQAR